MSDREFGPPLLYLPYELVQKMMARVAPEGAEVA